MRKIVALTLLVGCLTFVAQAQAPAVPNPNSVLATLNTDFDALLTGIARDVAPTLYMNALAADVVGDATIDHFTIFLPALGANISSGIATILKPGSHNWQFLLPMDSLVGTMAGSDPTVKDWLDMLEGELMAYPSIKLGFGIGL